MTRRYDKRVTMQDLKLFQLEHPSANFWLLLQEAPGLTQGGYNKPGGRIPSPRWKSGVRA